MSHSRALDMTALKELQIVKLAQVAGFFQGPGGFSHELLSFRSSF
jgi:hypothetical protein